MPLDNGIIELVDKGMAGEGLTEEETARLLEVNAYSAESAYIRWGAWMLARKASNGVAEVHAQIGMDASSCPKNCEFCSFAACNGLRPPKLEMPKDEVVEYAKAFAEEGVNLVCLMVTANYDFNKYLEMGSAVREVINPETPLMANIDDFSYEQAVKLKEAGFDAIYHVVHMGEGKITNIDPKTRLETIANAKKAGLTLSSCVEPIGPEHGPAEVAKRIKQIQKLEPLSSGIGLRVPVSGSKFANDPRRGKIDWSFYMAVFRLSVGLTPKLCGNTYMAADGGANYGWAEVGTNPRDDTLRTDKIKEGIGQGVYEAKYGFMVCGWEILEGPSEGWRI
ncbi:MAG: radical SAM protein [Coriobacteriales bacterium]|jgi:biotin synthase